MNIPTNPVSDAPGGRGSAAVVEAKREEILLVAERLFFSQGYDRTTIDQIVGELGVTKPYLYYYFRNKQEILESLSWPVAVSTLTSMDFDPADKRPAHEKLKEGIERLIRRTVAGHPSGFFIYREPQAYRTEYLAEQKRLLDHFYGRLCCLMEQGRSEGELSFKDTSVTALAACSLPGFLYTWYRPDGRLSPDEIVAELTVLACRVFGLEHVARDGSAH